MGFKTRLPVEPKPLAPGNDDINFTLQEMFNNVSLRISELVLLEQYPTERSTEVLIEYGVDDGIECGVHVA